MRTIADQTQVEVSLGSGKMWRGTEAQLRKEHPQWVRYARVVQSASAPDDEQDDSIYDTKLPTSSRRYYYPDAGQQGNTRFEYRPGTVIQRRRSAVPSTGTGTRETEDIPQGKAKRQRRGLGLRAHPFLYLGIGMIAMLALWVGLQALVSWWNVTQDDIHYGRPRTFQLDAVFGHNDSAANPTHIIIVNLSRHIIIIELPGGDPSKSKIYSGPTLFGDGQDLTPVTGRAVDVNGDGKLDLVLYVQDQRIVFINDGTQFRPLKSGEQITIPK